MLLLISVSVKGLIFVMIINEFDVPSKFNRCVRVPCQFAVESALVSVASMFVSSV